MTIKLKKHTQALPDSKSLKKCLTECEKGEEAIVLNVNVGSRQKRRLANLGIIPGAKIQKKKGAPFRGPLRVIVKGSSLAIGRGLASKIRVQCNDFCDD
ncbi:MAG: FeoA family protein [Promethearchaeota archaeon]|jgi:DtxR family Mn-dependent transcriptional regulator